MKEFLKKTTDFFSKADEYLSDSYDSAIDTTNILLKVATVIALFAIIAVVIASLCTLNLVIMPALIGIALFTPFILPAGFLFGYGIARGIAKVGMFIAGGLHCLCSLFSSDNDENHNDEDKKLNNNPEITIKKFNDYIEGEAVKPLFFSSNTDTDTIPLEQQQQQQQPKRIDTNLYYEKL